MKPSAFTFSSAIPGSPGGDRDSDKDEAVPNNPVVGQYFP